MADNTALLIRTLAPEDFDRFWEVRLMALRESPEAFGASFEESSRLPPDEAKKRLSPPPDGFVLGAFRLDELVGVAGFLRNVGEKGRHKGTIWGVYVVPESRGTGVARAMMDQVLTMCRAVDGLEEVVLAVVTTNTPALTLYKSLGFETYGVEPRALKIDGEYHDEELMILKF